MNLANLTSDEKERCILEFKTRCYWFYRTYRINKNLFEDNRSLYGALETPRVINNALVEYLLLQPHLITDQSTFGADKNLSIYFFLEWTWGPEVHRKLSALASKLKQFVEFERHNNPRHKLLAHWDVETILSSTAPLGSFIIGEETVFFRTLNDFIETMVAEYGLQDDWTILTDTKADEDSMIGIIKAGVDIIRKR